MLLLLQLPEVSYDLSDLILVHPGVKKTVWIFFVVLPVPYTFKQFVIRDVGILLVPKIRHPHLLTSVSVP